MKIVRIVHADVLAILEHAKTNLISMPAGARLPGMKRPLTEGERLAVAYLAGSLMVAGGHGVESDRIIVQWEVVDSEGIE